MLFALLSRYCSFTMFLVGVESHLHGKLAERHPTSPSEFAFSSQRGTDRGL
jgi:hypothetical protein